MLSIKKYILQYIVLKILNNDYDENFHIPSENRLAIKFNCSRLTARSSLIPLVNIGVLTSVKGMGYLVSDFAMGALFYSKKLKENSFKTIVREISNEEIPFKSFEITGSYKTYFLENYDKKGNLLSISWIFININSMKNFYKKEYAKYQNPIERITELMISPWKIKTKFITSTIKNNADKIKELNYNPKKQVPIISQEWINNYSIWMFKTINISQNNLNLFTTTIKL